MAKCLLMPKISWEFQKKFIHSTFMPTCSRTKMVFPLKWVFSLLRFKSSLFVSRAVFQHESYQKRRIIFTKWHLRESGCSTLELFADAVTPQWCFWGCLGLGLHSAWGIPSLCYPRGIPEQLTKFRIYADISLYINSVLLAFRLLPVLILLALACVSENHTQRTLRDA